LAHWSIAYQGDLAARRRTGWRQIQKPVPADKADIHVRGVSGTRDHHRLDPGRFSRNNVGGEGKEGSRYNGQKAHNCAANDIGYWQYHHW
jgi:hypothetical protein